MFSEFRSQSTYQAEADVHFPTLTIRETLEFASKARRCPKDWQVASQSVDSEARTLGLVKALKTKMGNIVLSGVSGGERKRTSIAVREMSGIG
jgi:ABC-type multidrug transport system ATPase subunit